METHLLKFALRCMIFSLLIIFTQNLSAQIIFDKAYYQPVLTYGDSGEWDDGVVWNPAVIKDGDTLRMWYTGYHGSVWEPGVEHIGYAWSLDGIEWNKYVENPVLSATLSWEGSWVGHPVVIKDGDTLKMWYEADNKGYAESFDGINWTKHPEPLALTVGPEYEWDDSFLWMKTVIKEGNEYKMWYSGGGPGFPFETSIPLSGLATSPDGINWTKYDNPETQNAPYKHSDPVLKVGPPGSWDRHRAFEPLVLKQDTGGYFMMYSGLQAPIDTSTLQQTGYAYSTDGIHWEKDENNPIIKDDHSFVEWGRTIYSGSALHYDGKIHYWFACFHTPPYQARPQIGYAILVSLGIGDYQQNLQFQTYYNWPNPFTASTTLSYTLDKPENVQFTVYNVQSQIVFTIEEKQDKGEQQIQWNAEGLPAGMYYFRIQAGSYIGSGKMILLD